MTVDSITGLLASVPDTDKNRIEEFRREYGEFHKSYGEFSRSFPTFCRQYAEYRRALPPRSKVR